MSDKRIDLGHRIDLVEQQDAGQSTGCATVHATEMAIKAAELISLSDNIKKSDLPPNLTLRPGRRTPLQIATTIRLRRWYDPHLGEKAQEVVKSQLKRATDGSAGHDVLSLSPTFILGPGERQLVSTGIYANFPNNPEKVCIFKETSGWANKGLEIKGGVIDSDFPREWKVIVKNGNPDLPLTVEYGKKVAQAVFVDWYAVALDEEVVGTPEEMVVTGVNKSRTGGFGSTGN